MELHDRGHDYVFFAAVADGKVYVGSYDDNVYALNALTGALIWSFKTGDSVVSSPAVENGVVYVGSEDHKIYALNASDGKLDMAVHHWRPDNGVFSRSLRRQSLHWLKRRKRLLP